MSKNPMVEFCPAEQGSLQLEGWSNHNNLQVQLWRTVPLVRDEALEGAVALALSDPLNS